MRIEVEIGFSFKHDLPDDYRTLDLPEDSNAARALRALADRHPTLRGRLYSPAGDVRRDVSILINGANAARRNGLQTVLRDGDRITILPPVGGG